MFRRGLIFVLLLTTTLLFAEANKRLILKDGTYQVVQKYEIKGDRVRYLSAERYEWEEIPNQLIDWAATKKYEEDLKTAVAHSAEQVDKEFESELKEEDIQTPEVASNLRLPITGGVFVLDTFSNTPQLIELSQAGSQVDSHTGKNILWKTVNPLASQKQTVEVPGPRAKIQVHVTRPVIFLNVDTDPEDQKASARQTGDTRPTSDAFRFRFVKLEPKKNSRVLAELKTAFTGDTTQNKNIVETVGQLVPGGAWVRIQPKQDLPPGEYAVAELIGDSEMNMYVWDFGINPNAPESPTAWKPQAPKPQPPAGPPTLEKRQKNP
jgi:hypothetical protein